MTETITPPDARRDTRVIRVAHSPDSDDAFMFYALAADKIDTEGLRYVHELHRTSRRSTSAPGAVSSR
jgi:hypothetical protein